MTLRSVLTPAPSRRWRVAGRGRRGLRILASLLLALLLLVALAATAGVLLARRSLPQVSGEVALPGLRAPVTVYRDARGVPHVFARNEHDVFFAQGYVTAQDRLFQMDLSRRAAAGRLSEVIGEKTLDVDRFFRSYGLARAARLSLGATSERSLAALEAYADGVNAFIRQASGAGRLPLEFRLLGYVPEPWAPLDTLMIAKFMAYDLGGNAAAEVWRYQLVQRVGLEKVLELGPEYPPDAPTHLRYLTELEVGLAGVPMDLLTSREGLGSNNWVLAGSRTASGRPLLANDPHLGLGAPSIWYQTHLSVAGRWEVIGVTFPGAPGIVVGQNGHVAWGVTNVGADVQDLYLEIPNPQNPREFLYEGRWRPARVVVEEIRVKGRSEPVRHEVLITRHGPIITPVVGSRDNRPTAALALRWTAHEATREVDALLKLNLARNWREFREALRYFEVPAQNFVFAATDGTIAYRPNGRYPIRNKGDGLFPVPGWTAEYDWTGWVPWEELPEAVNPPQGWLATANARPVDDGYPYFLGVSWAPPYRFARLVEVLSQARDWTVDDMKALQVDATNLQARELVPLVLPAIRAGLDAAGGPTATERAALEALDAWDRVDSADAAGPAIWHTWYRHFQRELFLDEMGDELFGRVPDAVQVTDRLIREAAAGRVASWFNDVRTPEREGFEAIAAGGFRTAVAELEASLGKRVDRWRWGAVHQVGFNHPLGSVPLLGRLLNVAPRPVGGSGVSLVATGFRRTGPGFSVTSAAPWRQVVDLADPAGNSWDVMVPGQSGHFFSRHYADQVDDWLEGRAGRQLAREADLEGFRRLVLRPEGD